MGMSLKKRLQKAESLLAAKEKEYSIILAAYEKTDGGIDAGESAELNGLLDIIKMNRETISNAYFDKLNTIKEFDDIKEPNITVPVETYKYGVVKRFDDADYKALFVISLENWARDKSIALNSVSGYMKGSSSSDFDYASLITLLNVVFFANPYVAAVTLVTKTVLGELEKKLRAQANDGIGCDELHAAWNESISTFIASDKTAAFHAFIEDWKKSSQFKPDMQVEGDSKLEYIGNAVFNSACSRFSTVSLPAPRDIEKQFITQLLAQTSNDDYFEEDDEASDAEIHFICENYKDKKDSIADVVNNALGKEAMERPFIPKFKFVHGQLDDVTSGLLQAIKTVYKKGSKITDLPVLINITVYDEKEQAVLCSVKRRSKTPKDTNFTIGFGGSDPIMFFDFINSKIIESVTVGDLRYDS